MEAGPLDRRITWQTAETTRDLAGGDVKQWSTRFVTWCGVVRLSGAEMIQAGETVDEKTVKLRIRWRDGLSTLDRFQYDGFTWRVQSIDEEGRHDGLLIVGKTRADGLEVSG